MCKNIIRSKLNSEDCRMQLWWFEEGLKILWDKSESIDDHSCTLTNTSLSIFWTLSYWSRSKSFIYYRVSVLLSFFWDVKELASCFVWCECKKVKEKRTKGKYHTNLARIKMIDSFTFALLVERMNWLVLVIHRIVHRFSTVHTRVFLLHSLLSWLFQKTTQNSAVCSLVVR